MQYCRGADTSLLSWFLGTRWLTDKHIDMMMEELEADTSKAENTQVASLAFSNKVKHYNETKLSDEQWKKTFLYCYEQDVNDSHLEKLAFPVHINQNHWIAGLINFKKRTFSFGE